MTFVTPVTFSETKDKELYLWTNCTKPHCFPTGIFTEAISPY